MRKYMITLLVIMSLLVDYNTAPTARAANAAPTFSQNTTGMYFDGQNSSTVELATDSNFDIGGGDFTIDWWQKASATQNLYPRLFQFGDGSLNSDGFAASEEDGRLYFWLDNRPVSSRGGPRWNVAQNRRVL